MRRARTIQRPSCRRGTKMQFRKHAIVYWVSSYTHFTSCIDQQEESKHRVHSFLGMDERGHFIDDYVALEPHPCVLGDAPLNGLVVLTISESGVYQTLFHMLAPADSWAFINTCTDIYAWGTVMTLNSPAERVTSTTLVESDLMEQSMYRLWGLVRY